MSTLFKCYKPLIPVHTSLISRSQRLIHINHHKISINRVKHCNNGTGRVCCFSSLENRNNVQSSSELWLYNTMSKEKQVLKPKVAGKVGMYVCGVTAYNLKPHWPRSCLCLLRRPPQDLIQKGLLKYAEKKKGVMAVDSNSFPEMAPIHMVSASIKRKTPNLTVLHSDLERIHKEKQEKGKKMIDEDRFLCTRCGTEKEKLQAI